MTRAILFSMLLMGCLPEGRWLGSGGTPASAYNDGNGIGDIDLQIDPAVTYADGPLGFPIPSDATGAGVWKWNVPRGYHKTARMQSNRLTELGYTVTSTRPTASSYRLHVTKGERVFVALVTSPAGPGNYETSTLDVYDESRKH